LNLLNIKHFKQYPIAYKCNFLTQCFVALPNKRIDLTDNFHLISIDEISQNN